MNHHITKARVLSALITGGTAMLVWGVIGDGNIGESDWRTLGIGTILLATLWLVRFKLTELASARREDEHAIWEHGREHGEAEGYRKGRSIARPVVVSLPAPYSEDLSSVSRSS